jgi:hypothetical protein
MYGFPLAFILIILSSSRPAFYAKKVLALSKLSPVPAMLIIYVSASVFASVERRLPLALHSIHNKLSRSGYSNLWGH